MSEEGKDFIIQLVLTVTFWGIVFAGIFYISQEETFVDVTVNKLVSAIWEKNHETM